jgi:rubrerythrin
MGMKNYSILEAVEVALMMEEEGIRFYTLAEQKAGDPEMKKIFSFLRDKEHQHVETFRRLYGDLSARESDPDAELWLLDAEVSSYFRAAVDATVFPTKGSAETAIAGLHGVADILIFALRLEKDSILFYHELLANAPWPEAKELVEKVIAEERRHVVFIHEKLASLGG